MKQGDAPLYKRLGDAILEKINAGELGERLPPIRTLAAQAKVNNSTVVAAYNYLEQKRAVYSVRGSGFYVAGAQPLFTEDASAELPHSLEAAYSLQNPSRNTARNLQNYINFTATATPPEFFPTEDFRRSFDAVLARDGAGAFSRAGENGYAPLRETISAMLKNSNISATPKQIRITTGVRGGLRDVIRALIHPGDAVVLESPGTPWAAAEFSSFGAKIHTFSVTKTGLDLTRLAAIVKKFRPKIFFLSPNYQFPTGLCYTCDTKLKILELAEISNAHIIEADEYGNFFYDAPPVPLMAADTSGRVIYLKSFERVLAQGFAGYVAGDVPFNEGAEVCGYVQRGLDFYLRNCDFAAHCAKIRAAFAGKCRRAVAAAETFLSPYADIIFPSGGHGLWVSPHNAAKTAEFIDKFAARGVLVTPGRFYTPRAAKPSAEQHFRISFTSVTEDEISKGIGVIASVLARSKSNLC